MEMFYSDENELGKIKYDDKIIGNIIRKSTEKYMGKVMLSDTKGRIRKNSLKEMNSDDIAFMKMDKTEEGYDIDIYIVLRFGTSISETSLEMIDEIRKEIAQITDIKIGKIKVTITGMLSKNLIKRHIEVVG